MLFVGQCAGFGEDYQGVRDAKWAQQRFNAGGCDGKGPLFVLYPQQLEDVADMETERTVVYSDAMSVIELNRNGSFD